MSKKPNIVYVLSDQLRASSLPLYGETQIQTPNVDRLAREGITFTSAISACPLCTPYRAMLLTGRHPQTTGHIMNFMCTRHDEISIADVLSHAGYRTGWVGKWHLHRGSLPQFDGPDYIPEGRDRLGFEYFRAYSYHTTFFNGYVCLEDWRYEQWEGYETHGLRRYAFEFLDGVGDEPFCLFVSPHQPHHPSPEAIEHNLACAPEEYYRQLPEELTLPPNVPEEARGDALKTYRHYLAMILAVDEMLGAILSSLDERGLAQDTIVAFGGDHGTMMGAHGERPWQKRLPYEESIRVPLVVRWPDHIRAGSTSEQLISPVDVMPTLCSLCDVPIPPTVEGLDLSKAWLEQAGAQQREELLSMYVTDVYLRPDPRSARKSSDASNEWKGVRTKTHSYMKWLSGQEGLYDLRTDPFQLDNLVSKPGSRELLEEMRGRLSRLMTEVNDTLRPSSEYADWFDHDRRVIRNAYGVLGDPEKEPDWSLL